MAKKEQRIYQFKITLCGAKPPIWRRIQVPESYSFWDLHVAIQDAMGWEGYHLHQFEAMDPKYGEKILIGDADQEWDGEKIRPENKTPIAPYFAHTPQAVYVYDFGDDWEHRIVLEKILPVEAGIIYPRCIGGKRACPPEDCGGVWGYEELLKIISDPKHPEYEERMEWIGGKFDAESFDPASVRFSDPKAREDEE